MIFHRMTAKETMLHISAFVFKEQLCVYLIMCWDSGPWRPISHHVELVACDKWFLIDNLDSGLLFIGPLSLK